MESDIREDDEAQLSVIDPVSPSFIKDPFPIYKVLRGTSPVTPLSSGGHLLVKYSTITHVLKNPDFGNAPSRFSTLHSRNRDKYPAANLAANILPFMDKPEHEIPRRIIAGAYRMRMDRFTEQLASHAAQYAEDFYRNGVTEVIQSIAEPYTLSTMCLFTGVPVQDGPFLKTLSESFFYLFAPIRDADKFQEINDQLEEFRHYFRAYYKERQQNPQEDLISYLMQLKHDGQTMTEAQVIDTCILLFADGVENVHYGVGNVLLELAGQPEHLAKMVESPESASIVTNEALRLNSPAQLIPRIAKKELTLEGIKIKAGFPVYLALGSANRDESVFDEPDRFRLERDRSKVLTFGLGRHVCIGGSLAMLQISTLISTLVNTGVSIKTRPEGVEYVPRFGHRWPVAVNIGF